MKKASFIVSLTLGIAFGFPATPLRATQFAYVVSQSSSNISGYSIDRKTGALTAVPGSPFVTGGGAVAVDPTGRFAYVTQLMP
jgi:DNA-binding beta-propeller fold protein YncE